MTKSVFSAVRKWVLTILLALAVGTIFILIIGEKPLPVYGALLKGAFVGKLSIGTTLSMYTPFLLTAVAFSIASKVDAFYPGVEGCIFIGGIAAAAVGIYLPPLPRILHIIVCFLAAMIASSIWASIPAMLNQFLKANVVCIAILSNSVAFYVTGWLVRGPMSAKTANPQSPNTLVRLTALLKPSTVSTGLFIALAVTLFMIWMMSRSSFGFKIKTVGENPQFAEYVGINPKRTFILTMMLAGAIAGIAGCIEVLGVYGFFLDGFATGMGNKAMLAALIVKCDLRLVPLMAFFIAALSSGALGMQQSTGVPKSMVDSIMAVFIIIATMELLFTFTKRKKKTSPLIGKEAAKK